jgi:acetyl esterase
LTGNSARAAAQVDALLHEVTLAGLPPSRTLPLPAGRRNFLALMLPLAAPEAIASVEDRVIAGRTGDVAVRLYRNRGAHPRPATLFFHGGGFVFGDLDSHDPMCRALARESNTMVVAVDYRRAPEHPYPAALDDCMAVAAWVAEHGRSMGIDGRRLAVAGDSAGGTLAAAVALRARDEGGPPISFQLLIYPALDAHAPATRRDTTACDPFLTREEMQWFWGAYLGALPAVRSSGYAQPAWARDLAGLPPAHVVVAGIDPLRDEAIDYAERMRQAGVAATVSEYHDMIHGFLLFTRFLDDGRTALRDAAESIAAALTAAH